MFNRDIGAITVQRLSVQGCDTPVLGSDVAPWRFRTNPSLRLPSTPRTVLSDAWRSFRDVREVYFGRA